jgi:hypothetical protein
MILPGRRPRKGTDDFHKFVVEIKSLSCAGLPLILTN